MSIENEIAGLTQSTTDLLEAVNTKKATLDTAVSNAETAVVDATSQVSLAAAEKVGAQSARDEAETHKDLAYTYSQSAASAVAYQDLTAIAESKVETAVDVFVYDTRKDSDGGAWRKRTQGTSWYNEPLNTATRGSRKEFPAVAVIVAESDKVTIYDGDDPSLPMWMVFNKGISDGEYTFIITGSLNSVAAKNGLLSAGRTSFVGIDFLGDRAQYVGNTTPGDYSGNNISQRNGYGDINNGVNWLCDSSLVATPVNDVAMTVLPDAPIDPATGLPIPTIAVATDGGVSVIKDDGTVVDIVATVNYSYVTNCIFYGERLAFVLSYLNLTDDTYYHIVDIPSADINIQRLTPVSALNGEFYRGKAAIPPLPITPSFINNLENTEITEKAIGSDYGFMPFDRFPENQEQGSIAIITSDYNTGWMNGDIKLATLSDTDDTDLVGSELITNGDFTGWTSNDTSVLNVELDGSLTVNDGNGVSNTFLDSPEITTEVGKTYVITITGNGIGVGLGIYTRATGGPIDYKWSRVFTFTSNQTNEQIRLFRFQGHVGTATITSISMRLAAEDRSVNDNGLQVFGTVQKNPVATGADLVAYSGFSDTNYLMQPYNSDLDFGTGDFCIMGWLKDTPSTTATDYVLYRRQANFVGAQLAFQINSSHLINFVASGGVTITSQSPVRTDGWVHICVIRDGGGVRLYINSALEASGSNTQSVSNEGAYLVLGGASTDGTTATSTLNTGSLALWRVSATAPTAEQIAKIYRDEKVLFQEGAQATLYGTSDAVTALAYDDTTELLHVGTSSGRSVFQGLQRVDNTTDAVGTAISASNNLVVEE